MQPKRIWVFEWQAQGGRQYGLQSQIKDFDGNARARLPAVSTTFGSINESDAGRRGPLPAPLPQSKCHPQTIAVCQTRAEGLGLEAVVVDEDKMAYAKDVCGVLLQYPATDGSISDYKVRRGDREGEGCRAHEWAEAREQRRCAGRGMVGKMGQGEVWVKRRAGTALGRMSSAHAGERGRGCFYGHETQYI